MNTALTAFEVHVRHIVSEFLSRHAGLDRIVLEFAVDRLADEGEAITDASIAAAYMGAIGGYDGMDLGVSNGEASPPTASLVEELARLDAHMAILGLCDLKVRNGALADFISEWEMHSQNAGE